jgi:hypothetical protein
VLVTLAVVALFWSASEQHYRACVEAAPQRVTLRDVRGDVEPGEPVLSIDPEGQGSLRASIHEDADCSHWPF